MCYYLVLHIIIVNICDTKTSNPVIRGLLLPKEDFWTIIFVGNIVYVCLLTNDNGITSP